MMRHITSSNPSSSESLLLAFTFVSNAHVHSLADCRVVGFVCVVQRFTPNLDFLHPHIFHNSFLTFIESKSDNRIGSRGAATAPTRHMVAAAKRSKTARRSFRLLSGSP